MKTTQQSILRFMAIAFLVVTPLAMAALTIPRVRNSVLRITGLQSSESQPSVAKSLPTGTQAPDAKTAPDNPGVAESAEPVEQNPVEPSPVLAEKKTDAGSPRPRTLAEEPLTAAETGESKSRTASVPTSFAGQGTQDRSRQSGSRGQLEPDEEVTRKPREEQLIKAREFKGDLRQLPYSRPKVRRERPERELEPNPTFYVPPGTEAAPKRRQMTQTVLPPEPKPPAPAPNNVFEGLDRFTWGAGSPPDPVGDVGPTYYIQAVNTSVGIYRKSDGFQEAAFTFDTLMSQGSFGNQCDTENFGDPVVLYDTFEDRWILTDFAFTLDGGGNVNPAIAFQCFAVSQTGNPLTGGWYFYSRTVTDGLNDYPKLGIWPDGVYMSANVFGYPAGASFQTARVWAFNKAQMYAGSPTVKVVSFNVSGGDFTLLPSNARLQTGTPPLGRPNLFISTWQFLNAVTVYKFHVDWTNISLSTFTGPDIPIAATSWPNASPANVPQSGTANLLDSLAIRAMMQNQYTNFSGVESLWVPHTVRRANTTGFAAPRWYQVNVSGGTVAANIPQAATWDPDGANVLHRWMPSLAVDRAGNMAMGYSVSSSTTFPSIRYAGRLAADPVNTFSQTEQIFFTGTASQTTSTRWGDYTAMSLDPDGCTFWYTNEYANPASQASNMRWLTKFGSFAFPGCTPVGAGGTISGTVTVNPGGAPIAGATVSLGARSTTTDGSGNYSFINIPAGTYPSMTASKPSYGAASAANIVVTDGNTTIQNFSLTAAPTSACLTDTTQADFLTGVPTNVDLNTSPGDIQLAHPLTVAAQNTSLLNAGFAFTTAWHGQTFTATSTGPLMQVDINLFSLNCTTLPNITVAIRNASGNLPTGADLATATIPGFCNGATAYYLATFAVPTTVTAGTQYAIVWRTTLTGAAVSPNPRYVSTISSGDPYAGGRGASSTDGGTTWTGRTAANNDHGFHVYVDSGFIASGTFESSPKDANPGGGITPLWLTFSWNATTPVGTTVRFQLAGSNNVNGPFNFVGPDNTAATFFTTSPVTLSGQFDNFRYLEYKAYLDTTNLAVTPAVNDVTLCFEADAPVVTTTGGSLAYTENDPATVVDPGVTITDPNSATLIGASASITGNFQSGEDALSWIDNNAGDNITLGTATAQTITLTGTDTLANYELALRAVRYFNSSDNPSTATRTVTFTVDDGQPINNTGSGSRTITVTAVNDPPTFTIAANPPAVNEDAGAQTVNSFATGISAGGGETGQTLTFNITPTGTTGNLSFASGPAIDTSTGNLTYTTNADTNGTASFSVTLSDNGSNTPPNSNTSAPQVFTITVNAVNDAPTFQLGANPSVGEDAGAQSVPGFAFNFQPGPATATDETGQTLVGYALTPTGTTGGLTFSGTPAIDTAGALTFTASADSSGTATFDVVATDSGSGTPPNVNQSAPVSFTITVTATNDAPVNTVPGPQGTASNTPLTFSSGNGNQISVADADAGANTVQVTLTATDGTLTLNGTTGLSFSFSDGNGTGAGDGTADATMTFRGTLTDINAALNGLTYTPNLGFSGPATLTITSNDLGNTGSGGALSDTDVVNIQVATEIRINDASSIEPVSPATIDMVFTVSLNSPAPAGGVTVNFSTQDEPTGAGKAVAGVCGSGGDYVTNTGQVTFSAGQQVKTINVTICGDAVSEPDETFKVLLFGEAGGTLIDGNATGTIKSANTAGAVVISELRTSGPGGAGDDFVEIYNNSNSPLTVAASDASAGYGLYKMGADCNATPVLIGVIPNGTVIPARGHYLFVGSAYSLTNYGGTGAAAGNLTLSADIETDGNVGLFTTSDIAGISSVNRLDAVGFGVNVGGACNLLREADTLPAIAGNATLEHSYFRKMCDWQPGVGCTVPGVPKDTNNNLADFWLADTLGSPATGRLGAPGPENIASPIRRDNANNPGSGGLDMVLLDSTKGSAAAPNRSRDTTSGVTPVTFGTMTLRYRVTNNTGGNVTRLRYRIVDVSTAVQPAGPTADVRALTSSIESSIGPVNDPVTCTAGGAGSPPCNVVVQATTLETPPNQTVGGGYNSTLSSGTITMGNPLTTTGTTQSILINFKLGIEKTGSFRFYIIIEALP